jgi:cytidylate kinase/aminoglycoside phosphotransferase (APT) family kinase protein
MKQAVTVDIVAAAAAEIVGGPVGAVDELLPRGTLRSFKVGGASPLTVRVDEDPASRRVDVEAIAMVALQTAVVPAVVPPLRTRHILFGKDGIERRFLAYDWIDGRVLEAPLLSARAREAGASFAQLHGARVMDLHGRLPAASTTLLQGYRRAADELKAWLASREQDGLGPDLLTLTLSDLVRALRAFVVAQDNLFKVARRRVLCHGAPEPSLVVARTERSPILPNLALVGLDRAALGDAAFDLAAFGVAAHLDDDAEDALVSGYVDGLAGLDRKDPTFIPRYFACRTLELLARPLSRLERMARIKRGDIPVLGDPVVVLEAESGHAVRDIVRAMNGLRDLAGRARTVTHAEVQAMGRVVALEEMLLAGRTFRLSFTGEPYTGKTEVGAMVARRLKHRFFGTAALSRALALVEEEAKGALEQLTHKQLVARLFARGFVMEPAAEAPYYRAFLDGADITATVQGEGTQRERFVRAGVLLDDDVVRAALRDALDQHFAADGLVVEGLYAEKILPGRVASFHLTGDVGVRRARLMGHRDVTDEAEAAVLLARLDDASPPPAPDSKFIDAGSRPAAAAALEVLVQLLPPSKRKPDLTGRAPL